MSVIDSNHSSAASSLDARETAPREDKLPDVGPTLRSFGRYRLLRLLGRSTRSMAWLAATSNGGSQRLLVLPRNQPADSAAMRRWNDSARKASRISHPGLAQAIEIDVHDGWPYVAYEHADGTTLSEQLSTNEPSAIEVARWGVAALEGLAYAHEAGFAHHDLQPYMLALTEQGVCRVMGLEVASAAGAASRPGADSPQTTVTLQAQRMAAERDVLALGLILHCALAGQPALGRADVARAIDLMPPTGREIVRLPWITSRSVPDALRLIVNRSTDHQPRQRYRSARTLARALEGWTASESGAAGGPIALLLDRVQSVGLLPSLRGASAAVARMALMEREHSSELAEIVLRDPALTFEMLRAVNSAQVRGAMIAGSGAVLTVRRAIALIGLDGARRVALALRKWPGALKPAAAQDLERLIDRVKHAGHVAQALRPPGYDSEVVYVVALLQNLGRLVVQYHFPEEATQIRHLLQPAPALGSVAAEDPGLSEEAAALAVLGVDIESLGVTVAQHWGLDQSALHMMRRFALNTPVRAIESDDDALRATASCANELVDASAGPAHQLQAALQQVAQRYGHALNLSLREIQAISEGLSLEAPTRFTTAVESADIELPS